MGECSRDFDERHFAEGWPSAERFLGRFRGVPDLAGLRVLDVGCGRGNLAFMAARRGAHVTGIDPDAARIAFAREKLAAEPAEVRGRVRLLACGVEALSPDELFDVAFSKDAFEHIRDVPGVLGQMRDHLAPGGRAFLGFGPLYRSPFGDHGWAQARLPWGHLFLPESYLLGRIRRATGERLGSLTELELNQWSLRQFLDAFRRSGLEIESMGLNQGSHWAYRASRPLARLPLVGELFTFNVYAVLRKRGSGNGQSTIRNG